MAFFEVGHVPQTLQPRLNWKHDSLSNFSSPTDSMWECGNKRWRSDTSDASKVSAERFNSFQIDESDHSLYLAILPTIFFIAVE